MVKSHAGWGRPHNYCFARSRFLLWGDKELVFFPFGPMLAGFRTSNTLTLCVLENLRIVLEFAFLSWVLWAALTDRKIALFVFVVAAIASLLWRVIEVFITRAISTKLTYTGLLQEFSERVGVRYFPYDFYLISNVPIAAHLFAMCFCAAPFFLSVLCVLQVHCGPGRLGSIDSLLDWRAALLLVGIVLFLSFLRSPVSVKNR